MGYAELYANGYLELGVAVAVAVLIMTFVLAILWAYSEREMRMEIEDNVQARLEDSARMALVDDDRESV